MTVMGLTLFFSGLREMIDATEEAVESVPAEPLEIAMNLAIAPDEKNILDDFWMCCKENQEIDI